MNTKIKLCCGGRGCPTIEKKDEDNIVITDDYGNKVTMKLEEAKLINNALIKLWNS